jgi:hypothetical protein
MAKAAKVITRKEDACCSVVAAMYDDAPSAKCAGDSALPPLPTGKSTRLLQADVEMPLYEAVQAEMTERSISMRAVIAWCLEVFLAECRRDAALNKDQK